MTRAPLHRMREVTGSDCFALPGKRLRDEGVAIESWLSLELGGEQFLICYRRAEWIAKAQHTLTQSAHAIDAVHQQFKSDTWVRGAGAEGRLLLDIEA